MLSTLVSVLSLAAYAQAAFDLYPDWAYPTAVHAPPSGSGPFCAILFTHGSGSRANSLDQKTYTWDGTGMLVSKYDGGSKSGAYQMAAENYVVISPVMDTSVRQWDTSKLMSVLKSAQGKYNIDSSCIHTQGYSMGGKVTWFMAATYPETFASLTASAGFNEYSGTQSQIDPAQLQKIYGAGIGVRGYFGTSDDKQPKSTAMSLFSSLDGMGDKAASLIQVNGDHGTMSSQPWEQVDLWQWVASQKKGSSSGSSATSKSSASQTSTSPSSSSTGSSSSDGETAPNPKNLNKPAGRPKKVCKKGAERHRRRAAAAIEQRAHRIGPARLVSK